MRSPALLAAALLTAIAAPAAAQHYGGYNTGYGHDRQPSGWDVGSQYDRPGDYRCDQYWDANRTDCGAAWRDQRRYSSRGGYGYNQGYGHDYGRGYNRYGYNDGRYSRSGGYGGYGGYDTGATAYYGAYGRPDLVYPGGGSRYTPSYGYGPSHGSSYGGGRDPGRVEWCRATYRSYDANSGYYRAYSGRLVFCG